jgi:serine/threonine protein kinase
VAAVDFFLTKDCLISNKTLIVSKNSAPLEVASRHLKSFFERMKTPPIVFLLSRSSMNGLCMSVMHVVRAIRGPLSLIAPDLTTLTLRARFLIAPPHPQVGDFGLSKVKEMQKIAGTYCMTGKTGSMRYMAPEVPIPSFQAFL